jgi:transcription elongation factor GreA
MIFTRRKDTREKDTGPIYLTLSGLEGLKNRLERLKRSLPGLAEEVQKAAAYGDRSENAEYKEAKHNLRKTEGQIASIEDRLKRVVVISPDKNLKNVVQIGSRVKLIRNDGLERVFQILGKTETNPESGFVSNESPLGKAVLNKKVGDKFSFKLPSGGVAEYLIAEVENS